MAQNGSRRAAGAATDSVGIIKADASENTRQPASTQAIAQSLSRPIFLLRLEARPGVAPIRALRWLLKTLARQHGFRCLDVREGRRGRT